MYSSIKDIIRFCRILLLRLKAVCCSDLVIDNRTLIIAPHPDDEVIGCAGLIQQTLKQGKQIYICMLTGGEASLRDYSKMSEEELKKQRLSLTKKITIQLGLSADHLFLLNFPDGNINQHHPDFQSLKQIIQQIKPDAIYVPHQKGEGWSDHIEAGNMAKEITKDTTIHLYEYCVWFWYYNVWSVDWKNAFLLRMTPEEYQNKIKAIHDYITPLAPCGRPYSGVLPKVFIKGNQWENELYFRIK